MELKRYEKYSEGRTILPKTQKTWPLFGAGLENFGINGNPVERGIPEYSDDELLMRIDAVSLCYTDVKEIDLGSSHPRLIGRNLKENSIIPGHELALTVIGVGEKLKNEYVIGDRFTLQPDMYNNGKSNPFCFGIDGGYRQYAKIGKEVLKGDAGNYLIQITKDISYAAGAITEPWACIEAAYRMKYRNAFKNAGSVLIVGNEKSRMGYDIKKVWFQPNMPLKITISGIPEDLKKKIIDFSRINKIEVKETVFNEIINSTDKFDDIIILDCDAYIFNEVEKLMSNNGIIAIMNEKPIDNVILDVGRLHYDMTYFVGSTGLDIDSAYLKTPPRTTLKPDGKTWILGAGGPMGRLHLQRAIEINDGPGLIVASEVTEGRYLSLKEFFISFAKKHNKLLYILNPVSNKIEYEKVMSGIKNSGGFDDIQIMVSVPGILEESSEYTADNSTIELFAGLKRGTMGVFNPWLIYGPRQVRLTGHSGSGLDDQIAAVERIVSGDIEADLSVAAIGGINQVAEGITAMKNLVYPGKIIIYPHVIDFPITAVCQLDKTIPGIGKFLGKGKTWTVNAERYFLDRKATIYE